MEKNKSHNVYDIILIGDNLSTYMASIYLQTSNYHQLVINKTEKDDLIFKGFDKVVGVTDVKNEEDLLNRLREQTKNLKVPVIKEKILSIGIDEDERVREDKFEIITDKGSYYTKCLVYNTDKIVTKGHFRTNKNVLFNEAIELLGNGCKLSFEIRDFISKNGLKSEGERQNTKKIMIDQ